MNGSRTPRDSELEEERLSLHMILDDGGGTLGIDTAFLPSQLSERALKPRVVQCTGMTQFQQPGNTLEGSLTGEHNRHTSSLLLTMQG